MSAAQFKVSYEKHNCISYFLKMDRFTLEAS